MFQYPAASVGNSNFACDVTLRNALFDTSLKSLAIPPSSEEQDMFDLLNNQQWTLNVNLINTAINCSSISPYEIIGTSSIALSLATCKNVNSVVKATIVLSNHAEQLQIVINDISVIGGIAVGFTGSGSTAGSKSVQQMNFIQAFYNTNETLAQSILITLQLIMIPYQPTANQTKEPCFYGKCSSTGDPHLIPFASSYGGSQTSYWYQVQGWSLLIGNSFVTLYILSAASPYLVTNYVLIFHGASPCILIGNSKSPPMCANTTSATSTTLSAGSSWTHFHNTKCIVVHVDYQGGYYDFHIYHSYTLINLSAGQCQQTHGRIEGASKASLSVIPEVCNIFIAAAKKRAVGAINPNVIKMAQTSCVNDLQTSLDTTIAVAGISLVLHDSASSQLDSDDQTGLFHQIHALKHDAFLNATQEANELISNTKELCNEKNQCLGSANNINH
ncbi:unnamed protein product [Rotaria magnacalcarata]|uniref:Uncharacterized protein n=2 Tax=Rotaria magnacalcarata TaxID=392030 RepID=A0A816RVC1_9BILA|nr:unnamed protein product [Rotaria magnacalcarata]